MRVILVYIKAWSLNQSAATASSEPILKKANLIAIFERKMTVMIRKHLGINHLLSDSSYCHFSFKDHWQQLAVAALIDLKIKLRSNPGMMCKIFISDNQLYNLCLGVLIVNGNEMHLFFWAKVFPLFPCCKYFAYTRSQGLKNISSLKSLKIQNHAKNTGICHETEMASAKL